MNGCKLSLAVPGLQDRRRWMEAEEAIQIRKASLRRSKPDGPPVVVVFVITVRDD
jgi:hypothetical protein